jgi:hypothetical protein
VVVLGDALPVQGPDERLLAMEAFTERMVPGRWAEVREPSRQEFKGTRVLSMRLNESSAKVRTGPPVDDLEDRERQVWAGVIPVHTTAGAPIADEFTPPLIAPSAAVTDWTPRRLDAAGPRADGY